MGFSNIVIPSELQERINAATENVIDQYRYFHELLAALVKINDMESAKFARVLSDASGHEYSVSQIKRLLSGEHVPSYTFVEDLLKTNVLNLNPVWIRPKANEMDAGPTRESIFKLAGFIEVTAQTVDQFNAEVINRAKEYNERFPDRPFHWADIVKRMIEFQMQGGRLTFEEIEKVMNVLNNGNFKPARLRYILNKNNTANDTEKKAIYDFLNLIPEQREWLDGKDVGRGNLPTRETTFTRQFETITEKLLKEGFTLERLAEETTQLGKDIQPVTWKTMSQWRLGKKTPNINHMRTLVALLDRFTPAGSDQPKIQAGIILKNEIDNLLKALGTNREALFATSDVIIAAARENPVPVSELMNTIRTAPDVNVNMKFEPLLFEGTVPDAKLKPGSSTPYWSQARLRREMEYFSAVRQARGYPPYTPDQIDDVRAIGERDHVAQSQIRPCNRHPFTLWQDRIIRVGLQNGPQVMP
jgi:hypothetical protein